MESLDRKETALIGIASLIANDLANVKALRDILDGEDITESKSIFTLREKEPVLDEDSIFSLRAEVPIVEEDSIFSLQKEEPTIAEDSIFSLQKEEPTIAEDSIFSLRKEEPTIAEDSIFSLQKEVPTIAEDNIFSINRPLSVDHVRLVSTGYFGSELFDLEHDFDTFYVEYELPFSYYGQDFVVYGIRKGRHIGTPLGYIRMPVDHRRLLPFIPRDEDARGMGRYPVEFMGYDSSDRENEYTKFKL